MITEINSILLDDNETITETLHEFWQRKERRIEASKRPGTVNLIKAVERAYQDEYPDDACEKICRMMKTQLMSKVKFWSSKARNGGIRLYPDDFEEVFWEAVRAMVLEDYNGGDFWLYENIMKKMDSRALDLIRWAKRNCRKQDYTALSLDAILDMPDPRTNHVEDDTANRDLIAHMMRDTSLDDKERRLLLYLYDEPDATLQRIADDLQFGHKETVRRVINKVKAKLSKYKQYM